MRKDIPFHRQTKIIWKTSMKKKAHLSALDVYKCAKWKKKKRRKKPKFSLPIFQY